PRQQLPFLVLERREQQRREQFLRRPVAQAPRERLGVALRRRRIGQRTGVLVDPERERRRLERCHRELALGEDAGQRRRERAVLREHGASGEDPGGEYARVVVEDDLLDRRVERDRLEL